MTNYQRGRYYEYRSEKILEAAGYHTTRAAGSHGVWDVCGFSAGGICLVQVKYNCNITASEREQFALFPAPPGTTKVVHRWLPRARQPIVEVIA